MDNIEGKSVSHAGHHFSDNNPAKSSNEEVTKNYSVEARRIYRQTSLSVKYETVMQAKYMARRYCNRDKLAVVEAAQLNRHNINTALALKKMRLNLGEDDEKQTQLSSVYKYKEKKPYAYAQHNLLFYTPAPAIMPGSWTSITAPAQLHPSAGPPSPFSKVKADQTKPAVIKKALGKKVEKLAGSRRNKNTHDSIEPICPADKLAAMSIKELEVKATETFVPYRPDRKIKDLVHVIRTRKKGHKGRIHSLSTSAKLINNSGTVYAQEVIKDYTELPIAVVRMRKTETFLHFTRLECIKALEPPDGLMTTPMPIQPRDKGDIRVHLLYSERPFMGGKFDKKPVKTKNTTVYEYVYRHHAIFDNTSYENYTLLPEDSKRQVEVVIMSNVYMQVEETFHGDEHHIEHRTSGAIDLSKKEGDGVTIVNQTPGRPFLKYSSHIMSITPGRRSQTETDFWTAGLAHGKGKAMLIQGKHTYTVDNY